MAKVILVTFISLVLQSCSFTDEPSSLFSTSVQGIFSAAYSTDGNHVLAGSIQHGGSLWDVENAERLFNWNHQATVSSQITAVAFSPEGDFALTCDGSTLVLWDVGSGEALRFFDVPSDVLHVALSPSARTALLGLANGNAVLFDVQHGGIIKELEQGHRILSMALSANGTFALFGLDNRQAKFWNLQSMELINEIKTQGRVQTVALSDDGRFGLLTVQHVDAVVWDMQKDTLHSKLNYSNRFFPSFSSFVAARFSKDGTQLLTGNTTGAIELWSRADGARLNRWITPTGNGVRPRIFPVTAVALNDQLGYVSAITSDGTSYRYEL
ncbi:MAG: WD40 repeat protein [Pseudohongiellaceae bacterium]